MGPPTLAQAREQAQADFEKDPYCEWGRSLFLVCGEKDGVVLKVRSGKYGGNYLCSQHMKMAIDEDESRPLAQWIGNTGTEEWHGKIH